MRVTFWGVRGSIPTPGPGTVSVGGNTSCVEVRAGGAILIFDGGTGLRLLGKKLLEEMPIDAHLFFSHVHWDHIQGFPFFDPAFVAGNAIHLYGGTNVSRTLEEILAGQMDHPNFPVHLSQMAAKMTFHGISEGSRLEIASGQKSPVIVTARSGNHPNGVWAYRVDFGGKSVVYATDTEQYGRVDERIAELSASADVLIHDAQYTPEEYVGTKGRSKVGWGHSPFDEAVRVAQAAHVKQLVLYHHDPMQSDEEVKTKERRARDMFRNTVAAYEGLTISL